MEHKSLHEVVEWVGGILPLPFFVGNTSAQFQPEGIFWIDNYGMVLGSDIHEPGQALQHIVESLRKAITSPEAVRTNVPTRVRVNSQDVADVLETEVPGLDIVCAATPELEAMLRKMRKDFSEGNAGEGPTSYLDGDVPAERVGALFEVAAKLYKFRPWELLPPDLTDIRCSIRKLGIKDGIVTVIGQMGESFGVIFFPSQVDFDTYMDLAAQGPDGFQTPPEMQLSMCSLSFEQGAALEPDLRKEIAKNGWVVAANDAYPVVVVSEGPLLARPASLDEWTALEAIVQTLPRFLTPAYAVAEAVHEGRTITKNHRAKTSAGSIEISYEYPHTPLEIVPEEELMLRLREWINAKESGAEGSFEELEVLNWNLDRAFRASREFGRCSEWDYWTFLLQPMSDYVGSTVATADTGDLREMIFYWLPRKVSVPGTEACTILADCRAFYSYLKRECELPQADACMEELSASKACELEAKLSDSRNFGLVKGLVATGEAAGFDMGTEEGIQAWLEASQGSPLPLTGNEWSDERGGKATPPSKAAKRRAKQKRKASRKARKRNQ